MDDSILPGTDLEVLGVLGGSKRSLVRRVRAGSRTLILKEFQDAGEGWVRESAALSMMPPGVPVPKLVDPPLIMPGPTRRAMVLHRMRYAAGHLELPALAELAGRLHTTLTRRWGEVPMAYAPSFADRRKTGW
jgi:hypothetical protein